MSYIKFVQTEKSTPDILHRIECNYYKGKTKEINAFRLALESILIQSDSEGDLDPDYERKKSAINPIHDFIENIDDIDLDKEEL